MKYIFLCTVFLSLTNLVFNQSPGIPPEKPKLIVGIVVSGMRYDYLNRYWNNFGEHGFKRLVSTGTVYKNAHHDYLIAESGPGYASLATGAYPDVHGVVSNYWYERLPDRINSCIADEKTFSVGGSYEAGRYSPSKLLALTASDQLKISNNFSSKVISVSLDPTASVLSGGHTADAAYWYDHTNGNWITSSFYLDSLPQWVNDINEKKLPDTYLSRKWETLLPPEKYNQSLKNGNSKDHNLAGANSFPYDLNKLSSIKRNQRDYSILRQTPFGNTYTKDMAISSIIHENMGKSGHTDWLILGFSANSYIGENFLSWSVEMEDTYLRLDDEIAHLLKFLDDHIGLRNVLVYLTAENAIASEPTFMLEHRLPSGYFNYTSAMALLRTYLNVVYGSGDWVKFYYAQQIYLNKNLIDDSRLSHAEFQNRVARFMVQFEGVSSALTAENLMQNNYTHGVFQKMQRTYNQKRSGDIILGLTPGWVEKGPDRLIASSSRYDTHVPLIFYGWKTGRAVVSRNVSITDITPTLSVLLNISRPASALGEVLPELVK